VLSRKDAFTRGVLEGSMKRGLDKVTEPISGPVAQSIVKKMQDLHPGLAITEDMIHACISSVILMGLGEMASMAGPHLPDSMTNKASLGAEFARKYAGEKFGAEIVELALKIVPLLMIAYKDVSAEDISDVLYINDSEPTTSDESVSSRIPAGLLFDEPEVHEQEFIHKNEPKRKKVR